MNVGHAVNILRPGLRPRVSLLIEKPLEIMAFGTLWQRAFNHPIESKRHPVRSSLETNQRIITYVSVLQASRNFAGTSADDTLRPFVTGLPGSLTRTNRGQSGLFSDVPAVLICVLTLTLLIGS